MTFERHTSARMNMVTILKNCEAASISYLHNALGQRVFKGEPQAQQTLPNETALGTSFIDWLKKNFSWLYATAQANTSIGTAFMYGDAEIPAWALLGNYDNGSSKGAGRTEYIWLPTEDGSAIPIGMYRGGKFYAIHTDHLGTPRLMTNEANTPVWQWPYSAFGDNKPTGVLAATANPKAAITNRPVLLKATAAPVMLLRFPGQVDDVETGTFYNYYRNYLASQGRYTQNDPIGLGGGLNRFVYANGNSISGTDPQGLFDPAGFGVGTAAGVATGSSAVVAGAAVGGAAVLGAGVGWGLNKAWEYSTGNTVGGSIYDTLHPDYSPWSPDPEKNKEFTRDRDSVNDVKPASYRNPDKPTCDEIRERIQFLEAIVARRVSFTNKWYGGAFNPGHAGRVDTLRRDIERLRARLARGDCAPC